MALLLCIDTSSETATIAIGKKEEVILSVQNPHQKDHASFVQAAIHKLMQDAGIAFTSIDAVAVVNGPGSYTGLRVGLASAKGICFAAGKPLILLSTLEVMAKAAVEQLAEEEAWYCPMIDARRDEVFTAVYDASLIAKMQPAPLIIAPDSFKNLLNYKKIYFFGSGHNKCRNIIIHSNAVFSGVTYSAKHINELSQLMFQEKQFGDLAYSEPFYVKEFYTFVR